MNYTIRKAVPADAPQLTECMLNAYAKYVSIMGGEILPPMQVDYNAEIKAYPVWVVEYNERIVAGVVLVFEEEYASLANIAVDPVVQKQGIGKALIRFAEKQARQRGYTKICLATHTNLKNTIEYYKKSGWIAYASDQTKVYMEKNL